MISEREINAIKAKNKSIFPDAFELKNFHTFPLIF